VEDQVVGAIEQGLLVFVGIARDDHARSVKYFAKRIVGLRVFADCQGRFDRSVQDVGGAVLVVSQFTLYGDCRRGRRPSFGRAAAPEDARVVYEGLLDALRGHGVPVIAGMFQAHMVVTSANDGPVTLLLDSEKAF
jgi:D-tyrosyl-tRNA(Tyr) deacylase